MSRSTEELQLYDVEEGEGLDGEFESVSREEAEENDNDRLHTAANELEVAPFVLRPYQAECVEACLQAVAEGLPRIGVSAPTGSFHPPASFVMPY